MWVIFRLPEMGEWGVYWRPLFRLKDLFVQVCSLVKGLCSCGTLRQGVGEACSFSSRAYQHTNHTLG